MHRGPQVMKATEPSRRDRERDPHRRGRHARLFTATSPRWTPTLHVLVQRKKAMSSCPASRLSGEIESVLFTHPAVMEACVIGVRMRIAERLSRSSWC